MIDGAAETLVIILSVTLAIFLLLSIIAVVKIIQILNHLKAISEKAEKIADSAESIGEFFKQGASTLSIARLLSNVHDHVFHHKSHKKKKGSNE